MPKHAANEPNGIPEDPRNGEDALFAANHPMNPDDSAEGDAAQDESAQKPRAARGRRGGQRGDDQPIGLTEAFAPVGDDAFREAQQAGDDHIGLTEAFAPVGEGAHAGGFSYQGDNEDAYPDALQSLEPPERPPLLVGDDALDRDAQRERVQGRHGGEAEVPDYLRKSRHMRRILIGVIIVLLVLFVAAIVAGVMLVRTASETAVQMAASTPASTADTMQDGVEDASIAAEKVVSAPDLASLLGMSQDDALAAVGRGATVTATREVNEDGNPIRTSVTAALTDEPADSLSGTPSLYLGLDESGAVVQAGYSAPIASLGFGSLSFSDAVTNDHVVEKTLQEAGIPVAEGAAVLPEDKSQYSTYDSAGTKLVRESWTFDGDVDIDGASHAWSATLSYDYSTANAAVNIADTVRLIYVYVNA